MQNTHTESQAFSASLQRTGALLIPIILALVIPLFYLIYDTFRSLSEIPIKEMTSTRQMIFYLAPNALYGLAIFAFVGATFAAVFAQARAFTQTFYNLPESANVKEIVNLRVWGKIPLPPPLNKLAKFPVIKVKDGKLDPAENWQTLIGGPAKLQIETGNALYLERGVFFSRMVGQGGGFLDLDERIKTVLHLGPQSKEFEVSAWTKDGILITLTVKGEYFLGSPEREAQDESALIPYDAEAARQAVEQTLMSGKEGHQWIDGAIGKTKGALSDFICDRYLEEVFREETRLFTKATMDALTKKINDGLKPSGICMKMLQITNAKTHEDITEQRMQNWEANYKSQEKILESKGRAHEIHEREKARAEMQRDLIYALANGLERINVGNFPEPLLLSVAAFLDQSMSNPEVRSVLAKEALETLEKTQEIMKFNLQMPGEEK